jgi:hypothetical protein
MDAQMVAQAQLSQLYVASLDGSIPGRPLTGGVCYCCKTSVAFSADDTLTIAWRHVYEGNIRDIAFVRSTDGGRTFSQPTRISEDRWSVAGCPDDGPAVAAEREHVHVVWPTVVTENGQVQKAIFYARAGGDGSFGMRQRIPAAPSASHPQLAVGQDGSLAVMWDESVGGARRVMLARGTMSERGEATFTAESEGPGVYPVAAFVDGALLRVWSDATVGEAVIRVARSS